MWPLCIRFFCSVTEGFTNLGHACRRALEANYHTLSRSTGSVEGQIPSFASQIRPGLLSALQRYISSIPKDLSQNTERIKKKGRPPRKVFVRLKWVPHKPEIHLISFEDADLENRSWSDDPTIWKAWGVIHFEVLTTYDHYGCNMSRRG